jgi:hypothetical protein
MPDCSGSGTIEPGRLVNVTAYNKRQADACSYSRCGGWAKSRGFSQVSKRNNCALTDHIDEPEEWYGVIPTDPSTWHNLLEEDWHAPLCRPGLL